MICFVRHAPLTNDADHVVYDTDERCDSLKSWEYFNLFWMSKNRKKKAARGATEERTPGVPFIWKTIIKLARTTEGFR